MIENTPLLIHIGYHKTATSWLQNELFISANDVFEPLSKTNSGHSTLSWKFVRDEEGYLSSFETNMEVIRKELLKILIDKNDIKDNVFVMSSERLSGTPRSGAFDAKLIAQRLAKAFPAAKILIVIR